MNKLLKSIFSEVNLRKVIHFETFTNITPPTFIKIETLGTI